MGGKRRIISRLNQPQKMAVADTKVMVNGCHLLVGSPHPGKARTTAEGFARHLEVLKRRASRVNLGDIMKAQMAMTRRLQEGKSILPNG